MLASMLAGTRGKLLRTELVSAVQANSNITVMTNAVCNGWFADNWLPIICGNRLYKVRATQTILCTGALEQPALFHNNDLPGVVMSSAAQTASSSLWGETRFSSGYSHRQQ